MQSKHYKEFAVKKKKKQQFRSIHATQTKHFENDPQFLKEQKKNLLNYVYT